MWGFSYDTENDEKRHTGHDGPEDGKEQGRHGKVRKGINQGAPLSAEDIQRDESKA
jgi:hypothetical protein